MFSQMIADVQNGLLPAAEALRSRLQVAMVKKLAMLRLPRQFHHNDPKINPDTEHMLWAAILLEDADAVQTLEMILFTEAQTRHEAQRGALAACRIPPEPAAVVAASLQRLARLAAGEELNKLLKYKIKKTSSFNELP
jgi:hypothetical protein